MRKRFTLSLQVTSGCFTSLLSITHISQPSKALSLLRHRTNTFSYCSGTLPRVLKRSGDLLGAARVLPAALIMLGYWTVRIDCSSSSTPSVENEWKDVLRATDIDNLKISYRRMGYKWSVSHFALKDASMKSLCQDMGPHPNALGKCLWPPYFLYSHPFLIL